MTYIRILGISYVFTAVGTSPSRRRANGNVTITEPRNHQVCLSCTNSAFPRRAFHLGQLQTLGVKIALAGLLLAVLGVL